MNVQLRKAIESDTAVILHLINEMAKYEKLPHLVTATEEILYNSLFVKKAAEVLLAEYEGKVIGFALYFHNFSTFTGKWGLYLEDLFVMEEFRGNGLGTQFFDALIKIAAEKDCGRMEWVCLNWNKPSIDFYINKIGASPVDGWTIFRLGEKELRAKANL